MENCKASTNLNTAATLPCWAGAGTAENPYQIAKATDMVALSEFVNTGSSTKGIAFVLMCDLDMAGVANFIPIGGWDIAGEKVVLGHFFQGTFNGNGKVIRNLSISRDTTNKSVCRIGLFGYLVGEQSALAEVRSLGLENVTLSGNSYVGALVGEARFALISKAYATGTVTGSQVSGGLVGITYATTVKESYTDCNVNGDDYTGGFCGENGKSSLITHCYTKGSVGGNNNIGGFCGINGGAIAESFVKEGITVVGNDNVGGFCGYNIRGNIQNCYASKIRILANWYVGGFCGYNDQGGLISNCYSFASVRADDYAGGFCGKNSYISTLLQNCYSAGSITSTTTTGKTSGGFLGVQGESAKCKNCYRLDSITSHNNYGTSKTESQLKEPNFVSAINDAQNPAAWQVDMVGAAAKNGGFAILRFQDSLVTVTTSCQQGESPRGSKSKPGLLIGTFVEHQSKVVKKGFMFQPSEGSGSKDWSIMIVEGAVFEKKISISRTYYSYKAFVENEIGEVYYGNIISEGTAC